MVILGLSHDVGQRWEQKRMSRYTLGGPRSNRPIYGIQIPLWYAEFESFKYLRRYSIAGCIYLSIFMFSDRIARKQVVTGKSKRSSEKWN